MLLILLLFGLSCQEIPAKWQQQCSFSELPIEGLEGQFNHSDFALRGLVIVFRHGERSGLTPQEDDTGCAPFNLQDDVKFSELESLVQSRNFSDFLGISPKQLSKAGDYSAVPERARCLRGQLTAEGALQHVKLGEFMASRYGGLLGNDSLCRVSVRSTNYNRTIQSAVAFSSAFFFPHREKLGFSFQVSRRVALSNFQIANNTLICFDDYCHCPYVQKIWRRAHQEEYDTFLDIATPQVGKLVENVRKLPEFAICREPHMVLDTALTRFICRKRELPCREGQGCLDYADMDQIFDFTTVRGWHWYNSSEKYMRSLVDDIKTENYLSQLFREVSSLERDPTTNFIRVISGHDITIGAIFHTLGVAFPDPPRYTSRISLEIFEKNGAGRYFRLLFNGEDYTSRLLFCGKLENGLCGLEVLRKFLENVKELTKETRAKCFDQPSE